LAIYIMNNHTVRRFIEHYTQALEEGDAALFVGAGLSVPAGFVDWKELMRDIADDLGLNVDRETDLVALAQYHYNERMTRTELNRRLIQEFTRDAVITDNHRLIARLPIHTLWTTNYDRLLEQAFAEAGKRIDVKSTQANLSTTLPKRDAVLYKMHGDIEQPQEAVLTKEDYETYHVKRSLFTTALQGDLVTKTFLFLGLSLTDPNLDYVLGRIRALLGENPREHFWITRRVQPPASGEPAERAEYEYEHRKQELRVRDLRRYGITAVLVDEYSEITELLRSLVALLRRNTVFLSGSAHEYGPIGPDRVQGLAQAIGAELMRRGYRLVSGFGLGIGAAALMGAVGELYSGTKERLEDRVLLRPFPQTAPAGMELAALWSRYRRELLDQARFVIFIAGNKVTRDGEFRVADGVLEEFRIAVEQGVYPIPVGATGYAAEEISAEVRREPERFFPSNVAPRISGLLDRLADPTLTNEDWLSAIFVILDTLKAARR
jgi:hypothetical protein